MGLSLKMQRPLPIGVDLGHSTLRLAQLRQSDGGLELISAATAGIPLALREDREKRLAFQGQAIHKLLGAASFKGENAILCLPSRGVFIQPVKLPQAPDNEVDNMIRAELAGKLPYPIDQAVVRHIPAGSVYADGGQMQEQIVVALSRADLDAHLDMARKAGLNVVGVDIEACAVVECFQRLLRRSGEESQTTLFLCIGSATTQVVMVHGQKMVFARSLAMGGLTLDKHLQANLKLPLEQAQQVRRQMSAGQVDRAAEDDLFRLLEPKIAEISDEIARCMVYYETSFNVTGLSKAVFLGGEAHNSRLCQAIAKRLNVPATVGDPLAGLRLPAALEGIERGKPQPSWAVAVGLSAGALSAA